MIMYLFFGPLALALEAALVVVLRRVEASPLGPTSEGDSVSSLLFFGDIAEKEIFSF